MLEAGSKKKAPSGAFFLVGRHNRQVLPLELTLPFAAAFGLVFGSYVNVVVYRMPRGLSTVKPASRCPRCVMPIRPIDNIPVLGYLWLFARCRDCGLPISPRYPLVELATGALFALCHVRSESSLEQVAASLFSAWLLALALIDRDHRGVPVLPTAAGVVLGLCLQPWLGWASGAYLPAATSALLAALAGALGAYLLDVAGRWFGVENGLGSGDALVLAFIGSVLGPRGLLVAFLLGAALASLCYVPKLLGSRRFAFDRGIPFVTFLSSGALIALFAGPLAA